MIFQRSCININVTLCTAHSSRSLQGLKWSEESVCAVAKVACGWKKQDEKQTHGSCLNWNKSSSIIGVFVELRVSLSHCRYIAVGSRLISAPRAWGQRRAQRGAARCGASMIPAHVASRRSLVLDLCKGWNQSTEDTLEMMNQDNTPPKNFIQDFSPHSPFYFYIK